MGQVYWLVLYPFTPLGGDRASTTIGQPPQAIPGVSQPLCHSSYDASPETYLAIDGKGGVGPHYKTRVWLAQLIALYEQMGWYQAPSHDER